MQKNQHDRILPRLPDEINVLTGIIIKHASRDKRREFLARLWSGIHRIIGNG